jgi:ribosomal-protein-alanine N-acetyltransferase
MTRAATLHTPRLTLRPPRATDVDAYLTFATDAEFAFFAYPADITREVLTDFIARYLDAPPDELQMFMVLHKRDLIGSIELDIDAPNCLASLGYAIARAQWNRGFATEAASAVIDYAFRTLGIEKVWARADSRNVASLRVLTKLGMQREGTLRQHVMRRGERVDRVCYGILRSEWLRNGMR